MAILGFDAKRLFHNHTGLGNYSRTLLTNLLAYHPEHEYLLFDNDPGLSSYLEVFNKKEAKTVIGGATWGSAWRSRGIVKNLQSAQIELYHGLSNELPINIKGTRIPSVVTIHDLIYHTRPQDFPVFDRYFYKKKTAIACEQADLIIAISEHTKRDIIDILGVDSDKVKVVYQSCDPTFFTRKSQVDLDQIRTRLGLPTEFILTVGSIEERKNLSTILDAYAMLTNDLQIPLVIVGRGKSYLQQMKQKVATLGIESKVIWLSNIEDVGTLQAIYQLASVFMYLSLYEGFGIPVIEAALSGVPIIASNTTSIPEAAGGGAFLVKPTNAEEIAAATSRLLEDTSLRSTLTSNALAYAQHQFSASKTANELMQVYRQLLP